MTWRAPTNIRPRSNDGNRTTSGTGTVNCAAPTNTYNSVNQLTSGGAEVSLIGCESAPSPVTATSYNSGDQTTSFTPSGQGSTAATYGGNGPG